jgi:hypothetical protein
MGGQRVMALSRSHDCAHIRTNRRTCNSGTNICADNDRLHGWALSRPHERARVDVGRA